MNWSSPLQDTFEVPQSSLYNPFFFNSSLWVPWSMTRPSPTTTILSALVTVDMRCANITVVRLEVRLLRASWIPRSVMLSTAEVASSNRTMDGFRINKESLCRPSAFQIPECVRSGAEVDVWDGTEHSRGGDTVFWIRCQVDSSTL